MAITQAQAQQVVVNGTALWRFCSYAGAYQVSAIASALGTRTRTATDKVSGKATDCQTGEVTKIVANCSETGTNAQGSPFTREYTARFWCATSNVASAASGLAGLSYSPTDLTTDTADANKVTINWLVPKRRRVFVI